jgi:hypothetical protein
MQNAKRLTTTHFASRGRLTGLISIATTLRANDPGYRSLPAWMPIGSGAASTQVERQINNLAGLHYFPSSPDKSSGACIQ